MTLLQLIVLAVIQGLTEFLPVSSSAHLILPAELGHWADQGLAFDTAVHLGTLLAVIAYFRADLWRMTRQIVRPGTETADGRLLVWLIVATLPALLAGALAAAWIEQHLRSVHVIAWTTIIFALFLWAADRYGRKFDTMESLGWRRALWIGLAQVLALVPGTSRSGITLTAGMALGLTREAAARFSFLMSIPVIAGACALMSLKTWQQTEPVVIWQFVSGAAIAGVVAWLTIALFLGWVRRHGLTPLVLYRIALGMALLIWLHSQSS